jgi:hypothetical protein
MNKNKDADDSYKSDTTNDESSTDYSFLDHVLYSDSDSEDNYCNQTLVGADFINILVLHATIYDSEHHSFYTRDRLCWDEHVNKLLIEGTFKRTYRMDYKSFKKLCT